MDSMHVTARMFPRGLRTGSGRPGTQSGALASIGVATAPSVDRRRDKSRDLARLQRNLVPERGDAAEDGSRSRRIARLKSLDRSSVRGWLLDFEGCQQGSVIARHDAVRIAGVVDLRRFDEQAR